MCAGWYFDGRAETVPLRAVRCPRPAGISQAWCPGSLPRPYRNDVPGSSLSRSRSSPARSWPGWNMPVRAAASPSAAIPRSSRCSKRPVSGWPSWPACGTTPRHSDIDLQQREITVRGKGGKDRIVRIGHHTARSLNRYLRARARHPQAWRPQLWLGAGVPSLFPVTGPADRHLMIPAVLPVSAGTAAPVTGPSDSDIINCGF
jgi:hypothetical protein